MNRIILSIIPVVFLVSCEESFKEGDGSTEHHYQHEPQRPVPHQDEPQRPVPPPPVTQLTSDEMNDLVQDKKYAEILQAVEQKRWNVNRAFDQKPYTLFQLGIDRLVQTGRTKFLETILKSGAEVNTQDSEGDTALHRAARASNQGRIIKLLLEYGAKQLENHQGLTPLDIAAMYALRCENNQEMDIFCESNRGVSGKFSSRFNCVSGWDPTFCYSIKPENIKNSKDGCKKFFEAEEPNFRMTLTVIEQTYRFLSRKYHPDRNNDNDIFRLVKDCRETLKKAVSR